MYSQSALYCVLFDDVSSNHLGVIYVQFKYISKLKSLPCGVVQYIGHFSLHNVEGFFIEKISWI